VQPQSPSRPAEERCSKRGYATRRRDPEDRRRHLVEVSRKGITVIEEVSEVMDGVEGDLLGGLEPAEREQLEGLLTSIWEGSGGYEAWSQLATDAEGKAA
jgi:DNA-binding MarR family transcriptional regulator